jgi:hypothetical protein
VVGDRCTERLAAVVLDDDRSTVAAALDRAFAADVLIADHKGYGMRHELLRDAVYEALPPARRRDLHARIAAALAAEPNPDPSALAHHWYEADEPAHAAVANLEAAALAERLHAPGEVHTFLERVLEHSARCRLIARQRWVDVGRSLPERRRSHTSAVTSFVPWRSPSKAWKRPTNRR